MYFIKIDELEGTILGLSPNFPVFEDTDKWYSLSEEAYDFILENNGQYIVDLNTLNSELVEQCLSDIEEIKTAKNNGESITNEEIAEKINYTVITINNLIKIPHTLSNAIANRIRKNSIECKSYIVNGITYELNGEQKQFTYTVEDQSNYSDLKKMIEQGIIEAENIPIRGSEDTEFTFVSVETFNDIYYKLLKNKIYQLFYLRQLNKYVKTFTELNDIHRLQYETQLPDEYTEIIDEQMANLNI